MWIKSHSIVTKKATKEQLWKLFIDVNNWPKFNDGIEFSKLEGRFETGNHYTMKPKGGPRIKVILYDVVENKRCLEVTNFPMAKMYYDHVLEDTSQGLKLTNTITMKGPLTFLWVKMMLKKVAESMPLHMEQQIKIASGL